MITATDSLELHLKKLLAQDSGFVGVRRRQFFDRLQKESSGDGTVVLMGAGNLGRRVLNVLHRHKTQVLAFCDNSPSVQGKMIDGVPVLSPEQAAGQFGQRSTFVVTMLNPTQAPVGAWHELRQPGCRITMTVLPLAWKYSEELLPNFFLDVPERIIAEKESVIAAFDFFADEESRREFVEQIDWRLAGNRDPSPVDVDHPQYFPHQILSCKPTRCSSIAAPTMGTPSKRFSTFRSEGFGTLKRLSRIRGPLPAWNRLFKKKHRQSQTHHGEGGCNGRQTRNGQIRGNGAIVGGVL